jgi:hypothetical protein
MSHPTEAILDALAAGQKEAALRELRLALEYPCDPGDLTPWCAALARVAGAFGDTPLAQVAELAAASPDDAKSLFDLGWRLVEARLYGPAATMLTRALAARPHEPAIVMELVSALESAGANAAAVEVLEGEGNLLSSTFQARYLLAFNTLMSGDLARGRVAVRALKPATPEEKALAARLRDMLTRAGAVADVTPLDAEDLRGWHYVLTGGLLLHTNPHATSELRGRYTFTQDSEARCFEDILRLRRLLGFLRFDFEVLLSLPDRDSTVFASAAGKVLRLPVEPWESGSRKPGLIVAYDLGAQDVATRRALAPRRNGQVLWSHTMSWTEPVGVTPEFVGVLHQINTPPWGARLVRGDDGQVQRKPARKGSVAELAARILAAPVEDLPGQSALDALAQLGDIPAAAWRRARGEREPLWFMGPVKSARFY